MLIFQASSHSELNQRHFSVVDEEEDSPFCGRDQQRLIMKWSMMCSVGSLPFTFLKYLYWILPLKEIEELPTDLACKTDLVSLWLK